MIILFGEIRKWDKSRPKLGLVDQKQQEQGTFSSVISLCDKADCSITAQLNQCHEKIVSTFTVKRRLQSLPISHNYYQESTVEEAKQCQKVPIGQGPKRQDNRGVK